MIKWSYIKLGDVCRIVPGGTPKTEIDEYWNGKIAWITPKDLSGYDYRYISFGQRNISKIGLANSSATLCPIGSVLLSTRAPIGYVAIASSNAATNQGMKALIPKLNTVTDFLYYLIKYNVPKMIHQATGSTFKEISTNNLKNLIVRIPNLENQKAIAKILSSLDDKIELNNKINKNLEELAQTLYKRWFVDFEFPNENGKPYKSSDGEMIESEIGLIPKGWEVISLGKMFKFIKGKKPNYITEKYDKNLLKYLTLDVLKGKKELYADKEKTIVVDKMDVTMVMDGASSGTIYYGKTGILSSTLSFLKPEKKYSYTSFLHSVVKYHEESVKERQTGSAIPHTDKNYVYSLKVSFNKEIAGVFDKIINNLQNKLIVLSNENEKLATIRDTLLPKLMSGEIEVPIGE